MARRLVSLATLVLATVLVSVAAAVAAPGDPDTTFGNGGRWIGDFGSEDSANDAVVQPDGKIVVASVGGAPAAFKITRLNPDGTPDASFGVGGTATPDFADLAGAEFFPTAVALAPNGKIVVVGNAFETGSELDLVIAQLLPNGQLDSSFAGGYIWIAMAGVATAGAVIVEPDGRVAVAGRTSSGLYMMRQTPAGENDPTFNNGLLVLRFLEGATGFGGGMVRLADGSYVLGATQGAADGGDIALVRVSPTGGVSMSDVHNLGGADLSGLMALQPDGKLVMATRAGAGGLAAITRFTPGGQLDTGFGNGGSTGVDFGDTPLSDVLVQPNGKLVGVGYNDANRATALRVHPGGALDTTFSGNGVAPSVFGGVSDAAWAGALQRNGAILVAGDSDGDAAVARLQGDPVPSGGGPGGDGPGSGSPGGGGPGAGVPRCGGKRATIVGTNRSERLKGTRRADVIVALGGNDRIAAGKGNDLICAGNGNDTVDGGTGNDRLYGQAGNDKLGGAGGKDSIDGGRGKDKLSGGGGRDGCVGGSGKDKASCERARGL